MSSMLQRYKQHWQHTKQYHIVECTNDEDDDVDNDDDDINQLQTYRI